MRRGLCVGVVVAIAALLVTGQAPAQSKSKRKAVAVMDFEYGSVNHWWSGTWDIGKGMSDQVVDSLVNDGTFRVIERKKLDTVLAEQDFAHSDRAAPSAAHMSKIGKVLGVRYIITGSITKFSMEQKGGGLHIKGIGIGGGGAKAQVYLTARMVDTTTGEVLISAKGEGVSKRATGLALSSGGTGVNMGSSEFRDSALGDAQEKACSELVKALVARADRLDE
jgi:curli biogenesis system outer membrane secretion channel CsgG